MSKRRIDPRKAKEIAGERMRRLMSLSVQSTLEGDEEHATRYLGIAKRIGMKTQTPMPKDIRYCKNCMIPLISGTNCSVRLRNHRVNVRCTKCGTSVRIPYIREQRDDRKGC